MSARRRSRRRGGSGQGGGQPSPPASLWRTVPDPPPAEPVVPTADQGAFLRSLGSPPLTGQGAAGDHYLAAVVERAAGLATALAAAADLLAEADDEA